MKEEKEMDNNSQSKSRFNQFKNTPKAAMFSILCSEGRVEEEEKEKRI